MRSIDSPLRYANSYLRYTESHLRATNTLEVCFLTLHCGDLHTIGMYRISTCGALRKGSWLIYAVLYSTLLLLSTSLVLMLYALQMYTH